MLNSVNLIGRLTADPELKTTPGGISVATFCLAVERNYAPQGEKRQTDFINCVAWRGTGEFISRNFQKGSLLALEGSIQSRNYEDRSGQKRVAYEVIVERAYFCGRNDNPSTLPKGKEYEGGREGIGDFPDSALDGYGNDLPF